MKPSLCVKSLRILCMTVLLSLAIPIAVPISVVGQGTQPPAPVFVEIQDFQEMRDSFEFQLGITNPRRVRVLYLQLMSNNMRVGGQKEYENPAGIIRDRFLKNELQQGRDYTIQIRATDRSGNLISLPVDSIDDRPITILAQYNFTYELPEVLPIDFFVRVMAVDRRQSLLKIELGGIDSRERGRVAKVEGYLLDENNQPIATIEQNGLPSLTISQNLEDVLTFYGSEQKFSLKMYIHSIEGMESEEVTYEITVLPLPTPTWRDRLSTGWFRIWHGIEDNPLLFVAIVLVALNTMGWMLFRPRRRKKTTRPFPSPVDRTVAEIPASTVDPPSHVRIEIVRTPDKRAKDRTVSGTAFSIGRQDTSVIIDDDQLSRRHLNVRVEGERVQIKDCGSKNGTSIDGDAIESERWMDVGNMNVIQLGPNTEIKLKILRNNRVTR